MRNVLTPTQAAHTGVEVEGPEPYGPFHEWTPPISSCEVVTNLSVVELAQLICRGIGMEPQSTRTRSSSCRISSMSMRGQNTFLHSGERSIS